MKIERGNLQDRAIIPIRSKNGGTMVRVKSIILNNFNKASQHRENEIIGRR